VTRTWHLTISGVLAVALVFCLDARPAEASDASTPDQGDADGAAVPADPITEVRFELRGVRTTSAHTAVEIALLREGERLVARTSPVGTEPGARHALALSFPEPLPISDCADLEIDIRLGAAASWSFTIESIELRTRSGRRLPDVFDVSLATRRARAAKQGATGADRVIALDPSRRGITLQPSPEGCP
jgi:hypothetical protein